MRCFTLRWNLTCSSLQGWRAPPCAGVQTPPRAGWWIWRWLELLRSWCWFLAVFQGLWLQPQCAFGGLVCFWNRPNSQSVARSSVPSTGFSFICSSCSCTAATQLEWISSPSLFRSAMDLSTSSESLAMASNLNTMTPLYCPKSVPTHWGVVWRCWRAECSYRSRGDPNFLYALMNLKVTSRFVTNMLFNAKEKEDFVRSQEWTCVSQYQWSPRHCFCELAVGLSSLASCRLRCRPSRSRSPRSDAWAWSPRRCRCRWPEPGHRREQDDTHGEHQLKKLQVVTVGQTTAYPLVGAPTSGQHEDVLHLPLLLFLLNLASLLFRDDVVPLSNRLLLKVRRSLFHAGEIGHLQKHNNMKIRKQKKKRKNQPWTFWNKRD